MDAGYSLRPAFHKQNLKAQVSLGRGREDGRIGRGVWDGTEAEENAEDHDTEGKGMGEETRGLGDNLLQRKQQA